MSDSLKIDKRLDNHIQALKSEEGDLSSLSVSTENNGAKITGSLDIKGGLTADGNTKVSNGDVTIDSANKIYLDGGGDTYIGETAGDVLKIYVGGQNLMIFEEAGGGASDKVIIPEETGLYFDGGADTYIATTANDQLSIIVGGTALLVLTEYGGVNNANFGQAAAGFLQGTATYNATDTDIYFSKAGNKHFLTFGSGNIADLNLYFPNVSCNCTLVLKQDGTGSRTVAADGWLAFDSGAAPANGSSIVLWPGGTEPTLTTDANAVDIISFYWDNTNEIAYGVISQDFK